MRLSLAFLALCSLSLIACDSPEESREEIPTIYASDFFPNSKGDSYTYEAFYVEFDILLNRDTVSYTIQGPVDLGGKTYMQYLPTVKHGFFKLKDTLYYRTSGARVYRWDKDHEELFIDLTRTHQKTDSLMMPLLFLDSIPIIKVVRAQFDNCIRVRGGGDGIVTSSLAKDIGMISSRIPDPDLDRYTELLLLSARVGGRNIP